MTQNTLKPKTFKTVESQSIPIYTTIVLYPFFSGGHAAVVGIFYDILAENVTTSLNATAALTPMFLSSTQGTKFNLRK